MDKDLEKFVDVFEIIAREVYKARGGRYLGDGTPLDTELYDEVCRIGVRVALDEIESRRR